jgi:DNA-binding MarR family transcriptional regulator
MLAGLVREGVVRRGPDADDRRIALIELTDAGRARVAAKREEILAARRRVFESLPEPERRQAAALLDRLAVAVEQL